MFTAILSMLSCAFIIFRVSSNIVSPVCRSSITSTIRSDGGTCLRFGSRTRAIRRRRASSTSIHPRKAYEMLSFQNDKYPYESLEGQILYEEDAEQEEYDFLTGVELIASEVLWPLEPY